MKKQFFCERMEAALKSSSTVTVCDADPNSHKLCDRYSNILVGETISHSLLSQLNLAPPLLARFQNGLLYRFIRGRVCTPEDLRREDVWRGVARRLGEWHARLPVVFESGDPHPLSASKSALSKAAINGITPGKGTPNLWTVMQKWILALPATTDAELKRKIILQKELERSVAELGHTPGLGNNGVCRSPSPLKLSVSSAIEGATLTSISSFTGTATSSAAT